MSRVMSDTEAAGIQRLHSEGASTIAIGNALGVSRKIAARYLRELGLRSNFAEVDLAPFEDLVRDGVAAGASNRRIAKSLDCDHGTVARYLAVLGLQTNFPKDADPTTRLMARVEKRPNGCWAWTGGVSADNGYGRAWFNGDTVPAHLAFYRLMKGEVPSGQEVDHLCHSWDLACKGLKAACPHRRCVNPEHLEAVTPGENQRRGAARVTHCPRGHEYTASNTYVRSGNHRQCRECGRARCRANDRRKRSARTPGVAA